MTDTDPLSAALEEKRAAILEAASEPVPDLEVMTWRAGLAAGAGHALLAALNGEDGVLKLHRPDHHKTPFCEECAFTWPCRTIRAITRALLGEDQAAALRRGE